MIIKCIIVDDEEHAQKVLEKYISSIPTLELVKKCDNAIEALSFLYENTIDIMFLDINMPELSGLEMLKTLNNPPKVILTTAYSEFALESYEYGVMDYLLKPIKFERFIKTINKVIEKKETSPENNTQTEKKHEKYIFLKEDNIINKTLLSDIIYIEAFGNYLKVFTSENKYTIRDTMSDIQKKLPSELFSRIHKSYIVSVNRIEKVEYNRVIIGNKELPIGNVYKNEFLKKLKF